MYFIQIDAEAGGAASGIGKISVKAVPGIRSLPFEVLSSRILH
jgi:hypothetical protein